MDVKKKEIQDYFYFLISGPGGACLSLTSTLRMHSSQISEHEVYEGSIRPARVSRVPVSRQTDLFLFMCIYTQVSMETRKGCKIPKHRVQEVISP